MSNNARISDSPRELQFDTKFNDAEYERFLLWFEAARGPSRELPNLATAKPAGTVSK
jgi:hypothetical protein